MAGEDVVPTVDMFAVDGEAAPRDDSEDPLDDDEAGDMIQVPLAVTDQPDWAPVGGIKYTQARPSGKWSTSLFNVSDHLGICGLACFCCTAPISA